MAGLKKFNSQLWFQDLDDIVDNPYDYENQKIFIREASSLLNKVYKLYDKYQLKFHINDISIEKCIWMLQVDALDTLRDCVYLLKNKKHRLVSKMFRDIVESLDIAHLIKGKQRYLNKWFKGGEIKHSDFRNYIKKTKGEPKRKKLADFYSNLSQFTHHTYSALKNSYSLGVDEMMVYDSHLDSRLLVLPEVISQYLWMISFLIKKFLKEMDNSNLFLDKEIKSLKVENLIEKK